MSTLDEFAKRIEKLEAEMGEIKKILADLVSEPVAIGPPVPEAPTEEAHVEVEPVEGETTEETREVEEIGEEDVGSAEEVLSTE